MATRLFVEGLPTKLDAREWKRRLERQGLAGELTDCKVLCTPQGKSRRVGFLGYSSPEAAARALKRLDRTYVGTSRLRVQLATPKNDNNSKQHKHKKRKIQPPSVKTQFWSGGGGGGANESTSFKRLFVRNLSYTTNDESLAKVFEKFGDLTECRVVVDADGKSKGFGFVSFDSEESAQIAKFELNGIAVEGRILHVISATSAPKESGSSDEEFVSKDRSNQSDFRAWNALFVRADVALGIAASRAGLSKAEILFGGTHTTTSKSKAVRVAKAELDVIAENKKFLLDNGIVLANLIDSSSRSDKTLILKNLPKDSKADEIVDMFRLGDDAGAKISSFVLSPSKTVALADFFDSHIAKRALKASSYAKYRGAPLYVEFAPRNVFSKRVGLIGVSSRVSSSTTTKEESSSVVDPSSTLFVKSLSWEVSHTQLKSFVQDKANKTPRSVRVPTSKNSNLPMGFAFLEFDSIADAKKVRRKLNGLVLKDRALEVDFASAAAEFTTPEQQHTAQSKTTAEKTAAAAKIENSTKVIVRNLAFEATKAELKELLETKFSNFSLRVPKRYDGRVRGFAFVDFSSPADAKKAVETMTGVHLYGRRLVLERSNE